MKNLRLALCVVSMMVMAGCAAGRTTAEQTDELQGVSAVAPDTDVTSYGLSTETETCTETLGPCRAGRCEFIMDHYQMLTEVCCTPSGQCETEHYKLCGC